MSDYTCTKCKKVQDISNFCKDVSKSSGLHPHCKSCRSERSRAYYINNKDQVLKKNSEWHKNNKKYHNLLNTNNNRKFRNSNPNHWRAYYEENKSEYVARSAKRRAKKKMATVTWADMEYIKFIYRVAKWLSLEVDHILPLQSDLVCGLHCEDNLQLLPMSENRAKGNRLKVGG